MRRYSLLALFLLSACTGGNYLDYNPSMQGKSLPEIINDFRAARGLRRIPISRALTQVGQIHVRDMQINATKRAKNCNLHSWSVGGNWTPCCYTDDQKESKCMWNKPRELSTYKGNGYEIAAAAFDSEKKQAMTPWLAVDRWARSSGHRAVMLNEGPWAGIEWHVIGGTLSDNYASAWFGSDPE
ncbi:MAG: CAP domain-containing protein [Spirochaetia bacterium]|nr:CAP domain-containing protein [Spirochaetia bacterium]